MIKIEKYRSVKGIFPGMEVRDGAGVRLKRYIGSPYLNYLDPFPLLDEFKSDNPDDYIAGFPPHPHRGFQTLTYMISGDFEHWDSTGSKGNLTSGGLQWMNAGSGVIHSEMPKMKNGLLWGFQLWLNSPAKEKMSDPFYHNFKALEINEKNFKINLLSGEFKDINQTNLAYYPFLYIDVRISEGEKFEFEIPDKTNCFCLVSEGLIEFPENVRIREVFIGVLSDGNKIKFTALKNSVVLIGCAQPLNEPVARWGPFVMNTKEEIYQAIEDYQMGRLVKKKAVDI
jgi:redox-sensitive bicupin YhaK (pirin superfamily)